MDLLDGAGVDVKQLSSSEPSEQSITSSHLDVPFTHSKLSQVNMVNAQAEI